MRRREIASPSIPSRQTFPGSPDAPPRNISLDPTSQCSKSATAGETLSGAHRPRCVPCRWFLPSLRIGCPDIRRTAETLSGVPLRLRPRRVGTPRRCAGTGDPASFSNCPGVLSSSGVGGGRGPSPLPRHVPESSFPAFTSNRRGGDAHAAGGTAGPPRSSHRSSHRE